jgi:hypothetical protein
MEAIPEKAPKSLLDLRSGRRRGIQYHPTRAELGKIFQADLLRKEFASLRHKGFQTAQLPFMFLMSGGIQPLRLLIGEK